MGGTPITCGEFGILFAVNEKYRTRAATLQDAERIRSLIHLLKEELVPRSMGNVVENIDRFLVVECADELVGCAAYQIWPEIGDPLKAAVEVQSVAVRAPFRRQGVGRMLVQAVIDRVRPFHPAEIVVLTLTPAFFETLGFHEIEKTHIMHKLYSGCINCTKHANPFTCPEKAMVLRLA